MTPVFGLCDDYMTRWAALDPLAAEVEGVAGVFGAATDYGPDGFAARAELITATLAALEPMSLTSAADRLAAGFLRERLAAQLAWHQLNEPLRLVGPDRPDQPDQGQRGPAAARGRRRLAEHRGAWPGTAPRWPAMARRRPCGCA